MIRKIVDDKTYIGCMVYGKTKIPDPGTGKEVSVPRNQWKVMENHHELYEKYHEGQMNQNQLMEAKMQLEEEKERLQKRVQELTELINDEKEILIKKNVPVEQMLMYLGYEKLTRAMLEEYVQGIYVYDDGSVEVEWKNSY